MQIFRLGGKGLQGLKKIGYNKKEELHIHNSHSIYTIKANNEQVYNIKKRDKHLSEVYSKTTCTSSDLVENVCKVSKRSVKTCRRSCADMAPTLYYENKND